jgi:HEAT repeat protein
MNYTNCKWCGSRLPEKAKKCEFCEKPVEAPPEPAPVSAPKQKRSRERKSLRSTILSRLLLMLGMFVLMIVGFGVFSYLRYSRQSAAPSVTETVQPVASEPVPIPTKELKSSDPQVRIAACEALSKMKPATPDIANALIPMLRDSDANVRAMCLRYVGDLGAIGADAIPLLIENLQDESMNIRMNSADALGAIAEEIPEETRVVQPLAAAMSDPDEYVRRSACWSLKMLGFRAEAALPAFRIGANDSSIAIRKCSMDAIAELSKSVVDLTPMFNALENDNADVRRTAAEALGKAGPEARRAIPALARLLTDSDEYVREAVVDTLGRCCTETGETVPLLNKALQDPSHSVRKYAVLHLGKMGPKAKDAVPGLIHILSGEEIYLRVWAAEALGNIGPDAETALPRLRQMKTEKIVSYEMEAAQLPGAVDQAIRKIEGRE